MPLRVSVGLTKKLGMPNYGSVGALCNVEIELDGGLLQSDVAAFQRHVRNAYVACRQAVQEELASHVGKDPGSNGSTAQDAACSIAPAVNGCSTDLTDATDGAVILPLEPSPPRISKKQLEYATQLAGKIRRLGIRRLDNLAQKMFGQSVAELSGLDGSNLIEVLKDIRDGKLELELTLEGATP